MHWSLLDATNTVTLTETYVIIKRVGRAGRSTCITMLHEWLTTMLLECISTYPPPGQLRLSFVADDASHIISLNL